MVQVVENWAQIRGQIMNVAAHSELADYFSAVIQVSDVTPVPDYPNLFAWAVGKEITINIPKTKANELALSVGDVISARVRKSGPTSAFVDPESLTR